MRHLGPRRTSAWTPVLFCLALAAPGCATLAQPPSLVGTWEYRQANSASPTGVDDEGERLVFRQTAAGQLVADYFGLERAGEHGLFYTAVEAKGLKVEPDGTIRLTIPARRLHRSRPNSLEEAATLALAGSTTDELFFIGKLTDGTFVVSCSELPSRNRCPDSRMVFRRLSPGAR